MNDSPVEREPLQLAGPVPAAGSLSGVVTVLAELVRTGIMSSAFAAKPGNVVDSDTICS
jgi:hypothetical protein